MPLDEESRADRRRDKTRRQYRLKNLPYHLDSSLVDDELSADEQRHGVGRALKRVQEGVQGNFDHISAEMTRFATLYNEGEADSAYMRDLLDPHDHAPGMAQNPARQEDIGATYSNESWYRSYGVGASGSQASFSDYITAVPIRFDDNVYVDAVALLVTDINTSVGESYRVGIYNGDNMGGLPGSLLYDAGLQATVVGHMEWALDLHLKKGLWYWIAYCTNSVGSGFAEQASIDNTGSFGTGGSAIEDIWWPFPSLATDTAAGNSVIAYDISPAGDTSGYPVWNPGDPLPPGVHPNDFSYVVQAPIFEVRVP